jgi:hypothetical protein
MDRVHSIRFRVLERLLTPPVVQRDSKRSRYLSSADQQCTKITSSESRSASNLAASRLSGPASRPRYCTASRLPRPRALPFSSNAPDFRRRKSTTVLIRSAAKSSQALGGVHSREIARRERRYRSPLGRTDGWPGRNDRFPHRCRTGVIGIGRGVILEPRVVRYIT